MFLSRTTSIWWGWFIAAFHRWSSEYVRVYSPSPGLALSPQNNSFFCPTFSWTNPAYCSLFSETNDMNKLNKHQFSSISARKSRTAFARHFQKCLPPSRKKQRHQKQPHSSSCGYMRSWFQCIVDQGDQILTLYNYEKKHISIWETPPRNSWHNPGVAINWHSRWHLPILSILHCW